MVHSRRAGWRFVVRASRFLRPLQHRGRLRRGGDSLSSSLDQSVRRTGGLRRCGSASHFDLGECGRRAICRALVRLIFCLRRRQVFGATKDSLGVLESLDTLKFRLDEAPHPRAGIFGGRGIHSQCQRLAQASSQRPAEIDRAR